MTIRRMKEVIASALNESLCQGCEREFDDGAKMESCYVCRAKVARDTCDILGMVEEMITTVDREIIKGEDD